MSEAPVYESVGTAGATFETPAGPVEVVGILYPTGIGEECEERYMTLPAAKALLIDLRDVIEACMEHQNGEAT
jgi:hypothetical protein